MKAKKALREEKELLEETAIKVQGDLDRMKAQYKDIVSTVDAQISELSSLIAAVSGGDGPSLEAGSSSNLSPAKIAQLRKLVQLGMVQAEKIAVKIKEKSSELEKRKQELRQKIRYCGNLEVCCK